MRDSTGSALPGEVSDYFASIYPVELELERKKADMHTAAAPSLHADLQFL